MSDDLRFYRSLSVDSVSALPLTARPWWMDAVSIGKSWDVVTASDKDGNPVAALPVHLVSRFGITAALLPQLTQYISPWVRPDIDLDLVFPLLLKRLKLFALRHRTVRIQLAGHFSTRQLSALSSAGFSTTARHSYIITPPPILSADIPAWTLANMSESKRRLVRRAQQSFSITSCSDPSTFFSFITSNLSSRGRSPLYSRDLFVALASSALANNSGYLSLALSPDGTPLAGLFMVSDSSRAFYLVPTYSADSARSGAMELLTFDAICKTLSAGITFDFEGSDDPQIAEAYRRYGGSPSTYHSAEWFFAGSLGRRLFSK